MKSIVIFTIVLLACVAFNEALKCYVHDMCSTNCPQLSETIKTCDADNNKCYKGAFAAGVSRGCAKNRCDVQINANSMVANVCCETDLCNSAINSKLTLSTFFMIIAAFICARM